MTAPRTDPPDAPPSGPVPTRKVHVGSVPANHRRGGDIRVLLSPRTVGSTSGFGGMLGLRPGEVVTEHYHPYSEEFLYIIAGNVQMTIEGIVHELGPGDSIMVPIGARHRLVNTGDGDARGVFHLSPLAPEPRLGHVDTEPLPNAAEPDPTVGSS